MGKRSGAVRALLLGLIGVGCSSTAEVPDEHGVLLEPSPQDDSESPLESSFSAGGADAKAPGAGAIGDLKSGPVVPSIYADAGYGLVGATTSSNNLSTVSMNRPQGLAASGSTMLVADTLNNRIRKISLGSWSTFYGEGTSSANLIINAGFDSGLTGWTNYGTWNTSGGHGYDSSTLVESRGLNDQPSQEVDVTTFPVATQKFVFVGFTRGGGGRVTLKAKGPGHADLTVLDQTISAGGSEWRQIRGWFGVPNWTQKIRVTLSGPAPAAFDALSLTADDGATASSGTGLNSPRHIAVASNGTAYVADCYNQVVAKVTSAGVYSTIAGTRGVQGNTTTNLDCPMGVAIDAIGNVYFSTYRSHQVMKWNGTTVTRIAGSTSGVWGFSGDNGPATSALLESPTSVAVDTVGNVYVADSGNQRIRVIGTNGVIQTLLFTSSEVWGLATTSVAGELYFSEPRNHRVRRVFNGSASIIAGTGAAGDTGDGGPATAATLNSPTALARSSAGNVYVADPTSNRIRIIAPCLDQDACNGLETFDTADESCHQGTPINPDDGEVCTLDSCVPASGPVHTNVPNGAVCSAGPPCSMCIAGACTPAPGVPMSKCGIGGWGGL